MSAAVIPAVIGEGLKPLTTSQTPSENSQAATGRVAIADQRGDVPGAAEQRGDDGGDEQGGSDESERRG